MSAPVTIIHGDDQPEPPARRNRALLSHVGARVAGRTGDLAELLGLGAIAVGVGMWSVPAGLVTGGVLAVVAAALDEMGKRGVDD